MAFTYDSKGRITSEGDGFNDPYIEYVWMDCGHNDDRGSCEVCNTCCDCCTCEK